MAPRPAVKAGTADIKKLALPTLLGADKVLLKGQFYGSECDANVSRDPRNLYPLSRWRPVWGGTGVYGLSFRLVGFVGRLIGRRCREIVSHSFEAE